MIHYWCARQRDSQSCPGHRGWKAGSGSISLPRDSSEMLMWQRGMLNKQGNQCDMALWGLMKVADGCRSTVFHGAIEAFSDFMSTLVKSSIRDSWECYSELSSRPRCVPSRVWLRRNPSLRPKLGCNLRDSELRLEMRFQSFLRYPLVN